MNAQFPARRFPTTHPRNPKAPSITISETSLTTPARSARAPRVAAPALIALSLALMGTANAVTPVNQTVASARTPAFALPVGVQQGPSVEGIDEYRLDNGLRVLLAPDDSKPTVTVNMTYLVGSRHENYGETGMAHLLEHLIFKGTPTTRNALAEFSRRGLRPNGTTSFDRTNFFASFAADEEKLDWYLGWQADAMINSLIARKDLDSEMTVVRNEFERGENEANHILLQQMMSAAYRWHNYGKSTIGARADIENVDIERLQAFYRRYYQPDNAVLIVSGKFDVKKTLDAISHKFGSIPRPTRKLAKQYTLDPVQDGERSVILRRSGGAPTVAALYHVPAAAHADYPAVDLLAIVLGDTPSGRLHKALVDTHLAASTFGFAYDLAEPGVAVFGAQLAPAGDIEAAQKVLLHTLEDAATQPFTEEDLNRARTKWLKSWELAYTDAENVGLYLSEYVALGDWRMFFVQRDRIKAVTLADLQRVAQLYFLRSNRTSGVFTPSEAPQRAPMLDRVDVSLAVKDYRGDPSFTAGENFDYSPENIDRRTERLNLGDDQSLQLALLPKVTRGHLVNVNMTLHTGDLPSLQGQREIAGAVAALLNRGTTQLTREQIQDRFDTLRARVGIDASADKVGIDLTTTRDNVNEAVRLIVTLLRNAVFPENDLAEYQSNAITQLTEAAQDPVQRASREVSRRFRPFTPSDPRYVPTFDEALTSVRSLKREQLVAFHQRFYGAQQVEFSAIGDFDAESLKQTLTTALRDWRSAAPVARLPMPYQPVKAESLRLQTPDKANAFLMRQMSFALNDADPDYPALMVANWLFGASSDSRLWMRVREREGLSYDVRSILRVSSFEPNASFGWYAIFAPSNLPRVLQAFNEEFERLKRDGVSETEVQAAIPGLLAYRKLSRAQDDNLAGLMVSNLELKRTLAFSAELDRKIAAIDANQVNAAIRKYWQSPAWVEAVAGDFSKVTADAQKAAPNQSNPPSAGSEALAAPEAGAASTAP